MTDFLVNEVLSMRAYMAQRMNGDTRRDYDKEFGYPSDVTPEMCGDAYEKDDISGRVVSVFPEECWSRKPDIFETMKSAESVFEKTWNKLAKKLNIYWYLQQVDILSGIGSYGVLFFGLDDGKAFSEPVAGVDLTTGERSEKATKAHKLLYLRAFDQRYIKIDELEKSVHSPRYGLPTMYTISFADPSATSEGTDAPQSKDLKVHWTRLLHVADNLMSSELLGIPRMKPVWKRLLDIKKVAGGSAEMFWKGAFPGISFETMPDIGVGELDVESLRAEFTKYSNGLQRYLALNGVTAKPMPVQNVDPTAHINAQILLIAIRLGVPARVLMGSEVGSLASAQDTKRWNERLAKRQTEYLTPRVAEPCIQRLTAYGVLPAVEELNILWPDMNVPTSLEKGTVAMKKTQAMAAYAGSAVSELIGPEDYLTRILEMTTEEAKIVVKNAEAFKKKNKGKPLGMQAAPAKNTEIGGKPSSKKAIEPKTPKP